MHARKQTKTSRYLAKSKHQARYFNRDISWLKFNKRVLDQVKRSEKTIFDRLRFLAISATNLDEFFMLRVGRLYNSDFSRPCSPTLGGDTMNFRHQLLVSAKNIFQEQHRYFFQRITPLLKNHRFAVVQELDDLSQLEKQQVHDYFKKVLFPIITPIVADQADTFPVLAHKCLMLGAVMHDPTDKKSSPQAFFIQIPIHLSLIHI